MASYMLFSVFVVAMQLRNWLVASYALFKINVASHTNTKYKCLYT